MKIAEIFHSIQGEGILTGLPSIFVRTSGCNLRCWYCDTPYTSWNPEGENRDVADIVREVLSYDCDHVVLTGGEPLLAPDLDELCHALHEQEKHITIETAATIFKSVPHNLASLSPKFASSTPWQRDLRWAEQHEKLRLQIPVIQAFLDHAPDYQLKFVVDVQDDLDEIHEILGQLSSVSNDKVLLMPQGVTVEEIEPRAKWILEHCRAHGFRYCPRLHIELFGNQRGT